MIGSIGAGCKIDSSPLGESSSMPRINVGIRVGANELDLGADDVGAGLLVATADTVEGGATDGVKGLGAGGLE